MTDKCRKIYPHQHLTKVYCLPLTQGKIALIDEIDLNLIDGRKWCYNKGYAINRVLNNSMHNFIMKTPKGMHTDHINGDTLDNRRCNLRVCLPEQNQWNSKAQENVKVKYKGVSLHNNGKYQASIRVDKKLKHLGLFQNAEDAAKAYDEYAKTYRGEYARTNF